ncbi:uncharacterized protein N7484_006374 [Penicillium longicatenatum]|uniref:uncharacterized protein n=1 Tax=Penicillium longicatenatum TaxID=1561947 RepID=UPI0025486AC9|nr:uncharacterized protein N7484_006374 [Penicillium longicatenatum]KAJ5643867.1 hypothetical protein N7484_006374 [Penicillium longicatenatum]
MVDLADRPPVISPPVAIVPELARRPSVKLPGLDSLFEVSGDPLDKPCWALMMPSPLPSEWQS